MAGEDKSSKTERATPYRRRQARRKGKVASSAEVCSAAVLLAALIALWLSGPRIWDTFFHLYQHNLGGLVRQDLTVAAAAHILSGILLAGLQAIAPILLVIAAAALLASTSQVGLQITPQVLEPKLSEFNPVAGCKKLFSLRSVVTVGTSSLKVLAIVAVSYFTVRGHLPRIIALNHATPPEMAGTISRAVFDLGLRATLLLIVIAAIDYAYQKWQYEKDLRMTKQEVKEERKLLEGRPETKQRIRSVQFRMARRRMLNDVKKADVVVRNPTHFAVVLKYDPAKAAAPLVLAKGADHLAQRILVEARKHRVPEMHDAPLAQAIYKAVEVGEQIPAKLYRAVARLLVHVFKLKGPPSCRNAQLTRS